MCRGQIDEVLLSLGCGEFHCCAPLRYIAIACGQNALNSKIREPLSHERLAHKTKIRDKTKSFSSRLSREESDP
jgi:hypothetical protein